MSSDYNKNIILTNITESGISKSCFEKSNVVLYNCLPNDILCLLAEYFDGLDLVSFIRCYPSNIALKNYLIKRIDRDYFPQKHNINFNPNNIENIFVKKALLNGIPPYIIFYI